MNLPPHPSLPTLPAQAHHLFMLLKDAEIYIGSDSIWEDCMGSKGGLGVSGVVKKKNTPNVSQKYNLIITELYPKF
jgi:hypothetical protein